MTQPSQGRNTATTPGALPPGTKLGKYEIVEQLGSGGQSIVYKGYDSLLDRHVAIKQIAAHLAADQAFVERFREVAKQLAKLHCEQIVTIHDLIEEDAGLFVVMEFVQGHSIETTLRTNPEPVEPKAVLQIVWRIAAGLAAIHKAGIVHRDVKPGNIMVGEGLRVKITDFGVAARAGTPASMRLGTTKYMAPELFSGEGADARADIYSLGMIAYEMLLGRAKFNEIFQEVVRDPHSEALRWMKWHSSPEQLAPLLTEIDPTIPPAMSAIVERMMAKDPDDRYASVEELGREIRANFSPRAGRPIGETRRARKLSLEGAAQAERRGGLVAENGDDLTVSPLAPEAPAEPATAEIPKQPMSRRKKLTLVGVVAGAAMVALIGLLVWNKIEQDRLTNEAYVLYNDAERIYKEAAQAPSAAEKRQKFAAAEKAFADVMNAYRDKARGVASQAGVMWYLAGAQQDVLGGDAQATGRDLKGAMDLNRQLQRSRGELYEWTQHMEGELDEFRTYWLQQREYADTMREARENLGNGKLDEALTLLRDKARKLAAMEEQAKEVEALRQDILEKQKQEEYWARVREGEELAGKGNVEGAIAAWDKAIAVLDSAKATLPASIYKDLKDTAQKKQTQLRTDTEYARAVAEAQKALQAKSRLAAADAYEKANQLKPDKTLLEKASGLRHDHYLELGKAHLEAGRTAEAEQELKKAQSFKNSPEVEAALKQLQQYKDYRQMVAEGDRLIRQRNYEGALEKYEAAAKFKIDGELKGKIDETKFQLAMAKAEGFRVEKKWGEARQQYNLARRAKPDRASEIDAKLEVLKKQEVYSSYLAQALEARQKGDYAEALAKLNAAKAELPTPEVLDLIRQVRYEEHLQLGRRAMEERDFSSAIAYFRLAKGFLSAGSPTGEIDKLIQQAQELKDKSGSS